ncbi:DUF6220 domain-containing protein [Sphaerothrix gracilis]|uniref:DUF6220 domain-containing protein n=1 Tax=Sphaerothrix gracilis TaxID=3151835 RepID=UPI0031FDA342
MNIQSMFKTTASSGSVSFGRTSFRLPFLIGTWLLVVCLLIQVFTVGMSVFIDPSWWATHVQFSRIVGFLSIFLFSAALMGRFPKTICSLAGLVVFLFFMQVGTIQLSMLSALSFGAAFHPISAFLLFWTATAIAVKTWRNVMYSADSR